MKRRYRVGVNRYDHIDYKDTEFLKKFLNAQGKIYPPKRYNADAYTQRAVAIAIKRARFMGLLQFVAK